MEPSKRILVLLESPSIRTEVFQYSVALAQRMGAQVILLLLLPEARPAAGEAEDASTEDAGSALELVARRISASGVQARCEVATGDPRSEFLKFMATHRSFQTAVWGGDPGLLRRTSGKPAHHWLNLIQHDLDCPLVAPMKK